MSVTPAAIEVFHDGLARQVSDLGGSEVRVESAFPHENWFRRAPGQTVCFHMPHRERSLGDLAERTRGGPCQVFQLLGSDDEPSFWASWQEEWLSERSREGFPRFAPLGISWTFFWGQRYRPKAQLLRAEWDLPRPEDEGEGVRRATAGHGLGGQGAVWRGDQGYRAGDAHAAQPHWHFDPEQLDMAFPFRRPTEPCLSSAALVELPPDSGFRRAGDVDSKAVLIELGSLHLAMGGWTHDLCPPKCWCHPLGGLGELRQWAVRVFEYCLGELPRIRIDL